VVDHDTREIRWPGISGNLIQPALAITAFGNRADNLTAAVGIIHIPLDLTAGPLKADFDQVIFDIKAILIEPDIQLPAFVLAVLRLINHVGVYHITQRWQKFDINFLPGTAGYIP